MASGIEAQLDAGTTALRTGDWRSARDAFAAALELDEAAPARFGLGVALWWLGDTEASLRCWEHAYSGSLKSGDSAQAAFAAVYLCLTYRMSLGTSAASNGCLNRAANVVVTVQARRTPSSSSTAS